MKAVDILLRDQVVSNSACGICWFEHDFSVDADKIANLLDWHICLMKAQSLRAQLRNEVGNKPLVFEREECRVKRSQTQLSAGLDGRDKPAIEKCGDGNGIFKMMRGNCFNNFGS